MLGVLSVSVAAAQNYQPTEYLQLVRVHVKQGMNAQFEDFIKKLAEGADKINAPQQWIGGEVLAGGRGNTYLFGILFDEWAQTDAYEAVPDIIVKAFDEKEAAQILRNRAIAVDETYTRTYRYLPDQSSTITTAPTDAKLFRMTVTTVKPEKFIEYNGAIVKAQEASSKNPNAPKAIRRVSVDGPSFTYLSTVLMKNQAERDGWDGPGDNIRKGFGDFEGGHIIQTILGAIDSNFSVVVAMRPDLSRTPAASTSN